MTLDLLKISAISGLIFLDTAPIGQWMISQPIVCAPLLGWLMGDLSSGLMVGVLLQLIWSGRLPIGSYNPPEASICSMVAVIIYIFAKKYSIVPGSPDWFLMFISIIWGIGAGILGGRLTIAHREFNNRFANLADQYAMQGNWMKIELIPWQAVGLIWLTSSVLIFVLSQIALAMLPVIIIWIQHISYFQYYVWVLVTLGVAVILDLFQFGKRTKLLISGMFLGFATGSILLLFGG